MKKVNDDTFLASYNEVVDYINQWNDTYYKAANDIEALITKYYSAGSLAALSPFYELLDAMKERSETHAQIVETINKRLSGCVQELL